MSQLSAAAGSITGSGALAYPSGSRVTRQVELIAECIHVRCDQPQVLDDERQGAQFPLVRLEEIGARRAEDRELFRMKKADIEELQVPTPGATGDVIR